MSFEKPYNPTNPLPEDAPDVEAEYARRLREAAEGPFDLTFGEPLDADGEKSQP